MTHRFYNFTISDYQADILLRVGDYSQDWYVVRFSNIEPEDKTQRAKARVAMRALARKGLLVLTPAFDEYSLKLLGSGYMLTPLGDTVYKKLTLYPETKAG